MLNIAPSCTAKNHISPHFTVIVFNVLKENSEISLNLLSKNLFGFHWDKRNKIASMNNKEISVNKKQLTMVRPV